MGRSILTSLAQMSTFPKPTYDVSSRTVHGHRLQSLHTHAILPLYCLFYVQIRDRTPALRSVTFSGNITAKPSEGQHHEPVAKQNYSSTSFLAHVKEVSSLFPS